MVSLVDVAVAPGNLEKVIGELSEAVTTAEAKGITESSAPVTGNDDDAAIPEKLRGKSKVEIAEMYRNLESAHGRMANDLGAQRSLTDRLLDLKRNEDLGKNTPKAKTKVNVTAADLLDKPTETLERFAEDSEAAIEARVNERLAKVEQQLVQNQFNAKHPDANEVASSPEFVEWVRQSPVRTRAAQAAVQGHFGAADDLLTEFKAAKTANITTSKGDRNVQDENIRAARGASLETGGQAPSSAKKSGSGKVYSRSDLMRLRIEKPETYYDDGFQNEIMLAYSEGRVR